MNLLAFAISVLVAFLAGIVFHKYVVSEAASIKAHVTAEIQEVRFDVAELVKKLAAKV